MQKQNDSLQEDALILERRKRRIMKIKEAENLTLEEFEKLNATYGGFETESSKNHPLREEQENFMEFLEKGSEKIKSDPMVKEILN